MDVRVGTGARIRSITEIPDVTNRLGQRRHATTHLPDEPRQVVLTCQARATQLLVSTQRAQEQQMKLQWDWVTQCMDRMLERMERTDGAIQSINENVVSLRQELTQSRRTQSQSSQGRSQRSGGSVTSRVSTIDMPAITGGQRVPVDQVAPGGSTVRSRRNKRDVSASASASAHAEAFGGYGDAVEFSSHWSTVEGPAFVGGRT